MPKFPSHFAILGYITCSILVLRMSVSTDDDVQSILRKLAAIAFVVGGVVFAYWTLVPLISKMPITGMLTLVTAVLGFGAAYCALNGRWYVVILLFLLFSRLAMPQPLCA